MEIQRKKHPVQIGESVTADFLDNSWTFELEKGFSFTGGKFAIVPIDTWEEQRALADKLAKALEIIKDEPDHEVFWMRKVAREALEEYNKSK